MAAVTRKGDSCTGHDCWPARTSTGGSPNVFANGIAVHRQGDGWDIHCCTHPLVPHGCHASSLASGSGTVFANGIPIGRIGDPVACGGNVASGSGNVFAG
jgi:uncharacterized Zn-binding protein involved in type VI secretion